MTKTCKGCGELKPVEDFHRHPGMKDGRLNFCCTCISRKNRERYELNREDRKARSATYRREHPKKVAESTRRWKKAHPERVRELNRESARRANPENGRAATQRFRRRHPEKAAKQTRDSRRRYAAKQRVRKALNHAVERGEIIKPNRCEDCGETPGSPFMLHGHHEDYDKPLEVEWLCSACHGLRHRED